MVKKELLAMRALNATPKMMKLAAEDTPQKRTVQRWDRTYTEVRTHYGLFLRGLIENDILKVAVYLSDNMRTGGRQPSYEVYIDRSAHCFITYDRGRRKWLNSKLDRISWPSSLYYSDSRWISPADNKAIKAFLGTDKDGYYGILDYQFRIREEELIRRQKKETDAWDALMAITPALPKDWTHWVDKVGIPENFIFYEYNKRGAKHGYCTFCGKEVPINGRALHNKKGRCTCCRHEIVFKAIGRAGRIVTDEVCVYLIQKHQDGFIVREFWASRTYPKGQHLNPEIFCSEQVRTIYDRELKPHAYHWGLYKQRNLRWIGGMPTYSFYGASYSYYCRGGLAGKIYGKTLPALAKTALRRTGLVEWIYGQKGNIDPSDYLSVLSNVPQLEQISKAGLHQLASECIKDSFHVGKLIKNRAASGLTKALGINSQELGRLREQNGGWRLLEWLQREKEVGRPISDEVITWFCKQEIAASDLTFIWDRMSALQAYNYLCRQAANSGESPRQVLTTWEDYLSMAERLGIDTSDEIIYRVNLLRQRHDELILRSKQKDSEMQAVEVLKEFPEVDNICQAIKEKYEYSNQKYAVVVPSGALDIITEGKMLNHCVGTSDRYWDRIERQEAYILFLRKASTPHIPYYTLEIEPDGTVRQKRTMFDRQENDIKAAEKFLMEWQKVVSKRLTTADLKKAQDSRVLREQEFEQMRKDNVTINVGELAGQRLVDVLTADLMENAA